MQGLERAESALPCSPALGRDQLSSGLAWPLCPPASLMSLGRCRAPVTATGIFSRSVQDHVCLEFVSILQMRN